MVENKNNPSDGKGNTWMEENTKLAGHIDTVEKRVSKLEGKPKKPRFTMLVKGWLVFNPFVVAILLAVCFGTVDRLLGLLMGVYLLLWSSYGLVLGGRWMMRIRTTGILPPIEKESKHKVDVAVWDGKENL